MLRTDVMNQTISIRNEVVKKAERDNTILVNVMGYLS